MSYSNSAALAADDAFRARVYAASTEQAVIFQNDGRYAIKTYARDVIANQDTAAGLFSLVCVAPGFGDAPDSASITDAQILSAVQASWPTYAETIYPPPPEPGA